MLSLYVKEIEKWKNMLAVNMLFNIWGQTDRQIDSQSDRKTLMEELRPEVQPAIADCKS